MKKTIFRIFLMIIILAVVLITSIYLLFPIKYKDLVEKFSKEYSLDKRMVFSVIKIESNFKKESLSKAGAIGLMQLLPSTASDMAKRLNIGENYDLYDEEINIRLGCYYLSYLLDYYDGNIINSLCAYNWGLSNVNNWIEKGNFESSGTITNIPINETKNYIKKYKFNYFIYDLFYNI